MTVPPLFGQLDAITRRPPPFSVYSAGDLWTDEHTSEQMLAFHLNNEVDLSSRREGFIDESVAWMARRFDLCWQSRIIDFGCGPGLYASRFAELCGTVTGVDFSPRSIAFARDRAARRGQKIDYVESDYLAYRAYGRYDLITLIMCDYCALSPQQRTSLLQNFSAILADEGRIVFDVYSLNAFDAKQEVSICERNLMDGFWSREPYFGFLTSYRYEPERVSLDKYTIVESDTLREVYNWLQYFSPDSLERELNAAGLDVEEIIGDVAGNDFDPDGHEFAVIAKAR